MTVRLITGDVGTLERMLIDLVAEARARAPFDRITILTGSILLRPYLRRVIGRHGGHVNLRIQRPGELIHTLTNWKQPSPVVSRYVVQGIARQATGYFAPVAESDGFATALSTTLADLSGAETSPDQLEIQAGLLPDGAEKLRALAGLQRTAQHRFAELDYDIALPTKIARLSGSLVLYGLWDADKRLLRLLDAVVRHGTPVTILLPETDGIFAPLANWALRHDTEVTAIPGLPPTSDLARLQAMLFQDTIAPATGDQTVRLVSAPDPSREALEAVRACLRWAAEGIEFGEMAVLARSSEYQPLLRDAFASAHIPVYRGSGIPITDLPAGRRVASLLRLITSHFERPLVLEFLAEAAFPEATIERFSMQIARWDALAREAGILEGISQWRDRLKFLKARCENPPGRDRTRPADAHAIDGFLNFLNELAGTKFPEGGGWDQHLLVLRDLVTTYVEGGDVILAALEPAIKELADVDSSVSGSQFLATVLRELERPGTNEPVEVGEFGSGVALLDVVSARNVRFKAVAILGIVEGAFPPSPSQDALLLDDERRTIDPGLPLRAFGPDGEPAQFLASVQSASERLQLSYARSNGARDSLPSYFFRRAASTLKGERVSTAHIATLREPWFQRVAASRFGPDNLEESINLAEYDRTLTLEHVALGKAIISAVQPAFQHGQRAWAARWNNSSLTQYDGIIADTTLVAARAGIDKPISPTALETYGTCPHRFLLGKILKLDPLPDRDDFESIEPKDRGTFVHDVLDAFLKKFLNDPPAEARRIEHIAALREIAANEWHKLERDGRAGAGLLSRTDFDGALDDILEWYDEEVKDGEATGFRPARFEERFGRDIPVEVSGVHFSGFIDRIDTRPDGSFRVIDYKTGSYDTKEPNLLRGGRSLQLPVYIHGAAKVLGVDPEKGESQYFYISRRRSFARTRFESSAVVGPDAPFPKLVQEMKGLITSGNFPPNPGDNRENCKYCDFEMSCDSQIEQLAKRKATDTRLIQIVKLKEYK